MATTVEAVRGKQLGARERILETAYVLFAHRVGIDEVIDRSRVAKATLYRHFPSKDDLVVAFLELREQRWTLEWVEAEARRRGSKPEEQLCTGLLQVRVRIAVRSATPFGARAPVGRFFRTSATSKTQRTTARCGRRGAAGEAVPVVRGS